MESFLRSRVPWEAGPGLKELAEESGVNYDKLIDCIGANKTDMEMAEELGTTEQAAKCLKEFFYTKGLGNVIGQD